MHAIIEMAIKKNEEHSGEPDLSVQNLKFIFESAKKSEDSEVTETEEFIEMELPIGLDHKRKTAFELARESQNKLLSDIFLKACKL